MVNVESFLLENSTKDGVYALVTYNGKTEATWFTRHNYEGKDWFLESPCELNKIMEVKTENDIREYLNEIIESPMGVDKYIEELSDDTTDVDKYMEDYINHMIVDDVLYEIINYQYAPYLPKEVDIIEVISERECLEYLLI